MELFLGFKPGYFLLGDVEESNTYYHLHPQGEEDIADDFLCSVGTWRVLDVFSPTFEVMQVNFFWPGTDLHILQIGFNGSKPGRIWVGWIGRVTFCHPHHSIFAPFDLRASHLWNWGQLADWYHTALQAYALWLRACISYWMHCRMSSLITWK